MMQGLQYASLYHRKSIISSNGSSKAAFVSNWERKKSRKIKYSSFLSMIIFLFTGYGLLIFIITKRTKSSEGSNLIEDKEREDQDNSKFHSNERTRKVNIGGTRNQKILTIFAENTITLAENEKPIRRKTSAKNLQVFEFPNVKQCSSHLSNFPIDDFPTEDPFLPWVHDYFVSQDKSKVVFVAQNKRRCETGVGKKDVMKFWEPQIALLQPIGVREQKSKQNNETIYVLAAPENATYPETRFICNFHAIGGKSGITFSEYSFNYEYINWRKRKDKPMFIKNGPDVEIYDFATLLFSCPIPQNFQSLQLESFQNDATIDEPSLWLDLIPIRTPARYDEGCLLTQDQVGPVEFQSLQRFNTTYHFGENHVLPSLQDSGRIANIPLCPRDSIFDLASSTMTRQHKHELVACTWAAASYNRRDGSAVGDAPQRLREWIAFHLLVGYDHIFLYDNTQSDNGNLPFKEITNLFPRDLVTHIPWPVKVCSNNFIGGRNPGERSSQYAAEASCRERFGPHTKWLSFMDIDEYFIPMGNDTWGPILEDQWKRDHKILGMRSSRALPRRDLMRESNNPQICTSPLEEENLDKSGTCLVKREDETFLRTYNCDYIRPPRPYRFFTNMKQIFRPDFVLSHFIHYSPVTTGISTYFRDRKDPSIFKRKPSKNEKGLVFLNELEEGTMLHARTIFPVDIEVMNNSCRLKSNKTCAIGFVCPESTPFDIKLSESNVFHDKQGNYCNCWVNQKVEEVFSATLKRHVTNLQFRR